MEVSHSVETAGTVRRMVDAGLTGRVAGHTVPVSSSFVTDSSCRADSVTSTVVHIISISTVVAL